jgi:hypothetical protein
MLLMGELLDRAAVAGQGRQRRRRTFRHADLVRVQRQRDHGVVADQRCQLDDAGGAVGGEDALVGRVAGMMVAQQFGGVVGDRLFVRGGECGATLAQRLDGLLRQPRLPRLGLVREPFELAVRYTDRSMFFYNKLMVAESA